MKMLGKHLKGNANQIEIYLEITILMIEDQGNVVFAIPLPMQENANEDVEPYAHIDGSDVAIEFHLL
jgi:hypothetical protein